MRRRQVKPAPITKFRQNNVEYTALRRWAREYEGLGEAAFSGNGARRLNKDHEIVKLGKRVDELESENEPSTTPTRFIQRLFRRLSFFSDVHLPAETFSANALIRDSRELADTFQDRLCATP